MQHLPFPETALPLHPPGRTMQSCAVLCAADGRAANLLFFTNEANKCFVYFYFQK